MVEATADSLRPVGDTTLRQARLAQSDADSSVQAPIAPPHSTPNGEATGVCLCEPIVRICAVRTSAVYPATVLTQSIQGGATCRKIPDVDLLQIVHALARKTCYTENAQVCQLVFC